MAPRAAAAGARRRWLRGLLKLKPALFRRRFFNIVSRRAAEEEILARVEATAGARRRRHEATAGARRRRHLFKVKVVPFRRRMWKTRHIIAAFVQGFFGPWDRYPCCSRSQLSTFYAYEAPLPFREQLRVQQYCQTIFTWLVHLRRLLAVAAKAWDAYNNVQWFLMGMRRKRQEQEVLPTATDQLMPTPPPSELDMC